MRSLRRAFGWLTAPFRGDRPPRGRLARDVTPTLDRAGAVDLTPIPSETPARCRLQPHPSLDGVELPPPDHALKLLEWLVDPDGGLPGHKMTSAQVMRAYEEMCGEQGLRRLEWQVVASQFKELTGGKKTYQYIKQPDGSVPRLRVYQIPQKMPPAARVVAILQPKPKPSGQRRLA